MTNETLTDEEQLPLRPATSDLEAQTVERHYCEEHRVVQVVDKLGRSVCPVCLVVEAAFDTSGVRP